METERDVSLGYEKSQRGSLATTNKRNGHSPKTLKSQYGEFQVDIPRNQNGEFEPKLIPKYQRDISGIDEKVISLYARGISTWDIHYKVREDGRILSRATYVVLGVTTGGCKDILSITVGANETSKFWLGMLNDLKNRGPEDVLFFCVDGLPGFKEAIGAVYPDAQVQRCVIHMLRNSFLYVSYGDLKKFSRDFKLVYNAPNEAAALSELEALNRQYR